MLFKFLKFIKRHVLLSTAVTTAGIAVTITLVACRTSLNADKLHFNGCFGSSCTVLDSVK